MPIGCAIAFAVSVKPVGISKSALLVRRAKNGVAAALNETIAALEPILPPGSNQTGNRKLKASNKII